jgi:hypothetical protein
MVWGLVASAAAVNASTEATRSLNRQDGPEVLTFDGEARQESPQAVVVPGTARTVVPFAGVNTADVAAGAGSTATDEPKAAEGQVAVWSDADRSAKNQDQPVAPQSCCEEPPEPGDPGDPPSPPRPAPGRPPLRGCNTVFNVSEPQITVDQHVGQISRTPFTVGIACDGFLDGYLGAARVEDRTPGFDRIVYGTPMDCVLCSNISADQTFEVQGDRYDGGRQFEILFEQFLVGPPGGAWTGCNAPPGFHLVHCSGLFTTQLHVIIATGQLSSGLPKPRVECNDQVEGPFGLDLSEGLRVGAVGTTVCSKPMEVRLVIAIHRNGEQVDLATGIYYGTSATISFTVDCLNDGTYHAEFQSRIVVPSNYELTRHSNPSLIFSPSKFLSCARL